MRIPDEQPLHTAEGSGRWTGRDVAEHEKQWERFRTRWNAHNEVVAGPLAVQWAQLDREPPFAVVGREGAEDSIIVSLGREDAALRFVRADGGREVTLPSAARTLGVSAVEMDRARAAILDGLEQSERSAGRSPGETPRVVWGDPRRVDRFVDALEAGYNAARSTLESEGFNVDGMMPGFRLDLSDEAVQRFAVLGRSGTANAAAVLAEGDRYEDLMDAVEVLVGTPWERSAQRQEVVEELGERLEAVGLRGIYRQTRENFNDYRVWGMIEAGDQISKKVAEYESAHAGRSPARSVRQLNEERMARQVTARIRDEDPVAPLRVSGPRQRR